MVNAPILPSGKRRPIRETPFEPERYGDESFATFEEVIERAFADAGARRCRQQVSRRAAGGHPYWVVQDVR